MCGNRVVICGILVMCEFIVSEILGSHSSNAEYSSLRGC